MVLNSIIGVLFGHVNTQEIVAGCGSSFTSHLKSLVGKYINGLLQDGISDFSLQPVQQREHFRWPLMATCAKS